MFVEHLRLLDLRRYHTAEFDFGPGVTAIVGPNGAGKTTVLEAVGWIALRRSFRGVPDAALIRHGQTEAAVVARLVDDKRRHEVGVRLETGSRSRTVVDGQP